MSQKFVMGDTVARAICDAHHGHGWFDKSPEHTRQMFRYLASSAISAMASEPGRWVPEGEWCCDAARERGMEVIAQFKPPPRPEWFPIETAPKGVAILIWCEPPRHWESSVWVSVYLGEGEFVIDHDEDGGLMSWQGLHPTHWMPVPEGPQ